MIWSTGDASKFAQVQALKWYEMYEPSMFNDTVDGSEILHHQTCMQDF